jgi:hypothetical protein
LSKQDAVYTRTATDIERKYNFGKTFAEMLGLIDENRMNVESMVSSLYSEILNQATSITRNTEQIIMAALREYQKTEDAESFEQRLEAELKVMAAEIALNFATHTDELKTVDDELNRVIEDLEKHFTFSVDGLTIKAGENSMQLILDNDIIRFVKNGEDFGWWDGDTLDTSNINVGVGKFAQFGDFAFVPFGDDGTSGLDLVWVGEE